MGRSTRRRPRVTGLPMGVWQGTQPPDKLDTESSEVLWRMSNAFMSNAPIAIAETLGLFIFILFVTLCKIMWFIPRAIIHPSIAVPLVVCTQKLVAHFWKVSQPNLQWSANLFCSALLWAAQSFTSSIGCDTLITIGKLPDCNLSTPFHLICCLGPQASVSLSTTSSSGGLYHFGFSGVALGMQLMRCHTWLHT